jgi:hypothetical protein
MNRNREVYKETGSYIILIPSNPPTKSRPIGHHTVTMQLATHPPDENNIGRLNKKKFRLLYLKQ